MAGGFWGFIQGFDINKAGFVIVGVFVLTWAVALGAWRFGRIEERWDVASAAASASAGGGVAENQGAASPDAGGPGCLVGAPGQAALDSAR
jgi:high-affinity nickel-transport protein